MTDKKISELTNILGSQVDDANDELAIVDSSAGTTNSITRAELFKNIDGDITLSGTVDGRDVAADGSKLDGIESGATADQTAGEIKTAYESNADTNAFTDAEQSKLAGIEAGADATDTTNVTAAGALMDSELTSEASVKALNQGVATTDSPDFAGLTVDTNTLYVDSSNNQVGIGTSSPDNVLGIGVGGSAEGIAFSQGTENYTNMWYSRGGGKLTFATMLKGSATVTDGFESSQGGNFGKSAIEIDYGSIQFYTNPASAVATGTAFTPSESMRIDSSGNLLVGKSSLSTASEGFEARPTGGTLTTRDGGQAAVFNRLTSDGTLVIFQQDSVQVGSVSVSGSTTSYNTSSDERLKENIGDAQSASDLIDGIQVREFDWKADGEHQRYGMIAQELEAVAPEAVTKGETEEDMWAVDYSKLVPMLVKEIQDLRKRVNELEATA